MRWVGFVIAAATVVFAVVLLGLLSLPAMLKQGYSAEAFLPERHRIARTTRLERHAERHQAAHRPGALNARGRATARRGPPRMEALEVEVSESRWFLPNSTFSLRTS